MKSAVLLLSVFLAVSYTIALSPPKPDGPPVDPTEVKPSGLSIVPFPPKRCGPICRMHCPNGFVTDSRGCPICRCKPSRCPRFFSRIMCRSCRYGRTYYTDKNGCRRCRCKRKPVCPMFKCKACPNGYVTDSRGCNTCTCKPGGGTSRCPRFFSRIMCRSCRYGRTYYTDKNGCRRCRCKRKPECPKRKCRPCPLNRYRLDSKGCQTCRCQLPKLPIFPRQDFV